jgi:hypothetical protein
MSAAPVMAAALAAALALAAAACTKAPPSETYTPMPISALDADAAPPPPDATPRGPRTVLSISNPFWVEVDANHVYVNTGSSRLARVDKNGAGQKTLLSEWSTTFAVDGGVIYLAASRAVKALPIGGGTATTLASLSEDPVDLEADGQDVFFTMFDGSGIFRLSKAGGKPVAIVTRGSLKMASIAVDATDVYWTSYKDGTVNRVPRGGGRIKTLAVEQAHPVDVVVDADFVYWSNETDGTIRRIAKAGGEPITLVSGQENHDILALDAANVYWCTWGAGQHRGHACLSVAKAGGTPRLLADDLESPSGIAVDASSLYIVNRDPGEVLAVPLQE